MVEHAAELGIDLKKGFLVGGDSAGGNLAAGVALKARDDPFFAGRPLTGQYLREPVIAAHPDIVPEQYKDELRSFKGFASTPILNTTSMLWFSCASWSAVHFPGHVLRPSFYSCIRSGGF